MNRLITTTLLLCIALALWHSTLHAAPPQGGFPIERVSVGNEEQEGSGFSLYGFPSDSGRYVLFSSTAENLVAGDSNAAVDVFLRDVVSGTTTLISFDSTGNESNSDSISTAITPSGRFILFQSDASDIVANDNNGVTDGYLHDRITNTTTRVTVGNGGVEGNDFSEPSAISATGRYIVFRSAATNLVAGDTNGQTDCFMRDRISNTTIRLTPATVSNPDGACGDPDVTDDGRFVAFYSYASNLVPDDTNNKSDIFVMDLDTGAIRLVSVNSAGVQGDDNSFAPALALSSGGYVVAFRSLASNLAGNDTNGLYDLFVHNIATGDTTIHSISPSGAVGNGDSLSFHLSADGNRLFFVSEASNLVANDSNFAEDAFVRDVALETTIRISTNAQGGQATGDTIHIGVSDNGQYAGITSVASNLVPGDTNGEFDVFLIDGSGTGPTPTPGATHTATASATPTSTFTPSPTVPSTQTPTVTPTGTLDPTLTPSVTSTGTVTPIASATTPPTTTPIATPDPTEFPATPTATTVPWQHHLYLPLTQR